MKILFVIHYPIFGGPHNQALQLSSLISACGWKILVLLPDDPGNAAWRLTEMNVEVLQMPLQRLRAKLNVRLQASFILGFWPEVFAIRRLLKERQIDLVLIGGLVNPHAAIAARLEGIPVVWQIIDTRSPILLRRLLMPLVKKIAEIAMFTGIEVARAHPGALEMKDRLVTFFPPVNTNKFQPNPIRRSRARFELGVPENAILIGTVGNINPQKGHEYLIQAGSIIYSKIQELFIRILGVYTPTQANYNAKLRKQVQDLGLAGKERLQFVDPGNRVADLLPAFDIFLLTSVPNSEGIPTAILEAMACGLPVVATDVGAVKEVVEDGVTGFVVPPLNPERIAQASLRLLNNSKLRRRIGETARRYAVSRYDVRVCADVHVKAFEAALSHHRLKQF